MLNTSDISFSEKVKFAIQYILFLQRDSKRGDAQTELCPGGKCEVFGHSRRISLASGGISLVDNVRFLDF